MRSQFSVLISGFILTAALVGCGKQQPETTNACEPACPSGQTCQAGACLATAGMDAGTSGCASNKDCPADHPVCDATSHMCTAAQDAGMPMSNTCHADADCTTGVCNPSTNMCQAAYCAPSCQAWETCTVHACKLSAGRCNTDTDCSADKPTCDMSHTCVAPSVTQPASLSYSALIVTNEALRPTFEQLAQIHTLTGVPTKVVTVESICAAKSGICDDTDPCNDTPKAIKEYLKAQQGLQLVVLGGGIDAVPSRGTHDAYTNSLLGTNIDEDLWSDYYYADFSNWDTNDNCVYGEPDVDHAAYLPNIGVTRIPSSDPAQLQSYFSKVLSYLTAYDTSRIQSALFISNIAAQLTVPDSVPLAGGETVNVDAAAYFEAPNRTLSIIPSDYDITKLYSTLPWPDAQQLTIDGETTELERSYNIVVHAGHGDPVDLTVEQDGSNEFSGAMAGALQNSQFPVMVSCACQAADFSYGSNSAGVQFIMNANGGGIGYMGNSAEGLGLGGGSQMVDEFLRYTFNTSNPLVGEAVMAGHQNEPMEDNIDIPIPYTGVTVPVPTIDANSYRWTQKSVTFLGDGLLPIWTDGTITDAPAFSVVSTRNGNFTTLKLTPTTAATGTLTVAVGTNVYQFMIDGTTTATMTVAGTPDQVAYGFSSDTTLAGYQVTSLQ